MRFEEACGGWQEGRLTQEEGARLLGVCERTFRRYVDRYEEEGLDGLVDKRLGHVSARRAPVDEGGGGGRSYTWVKRTLQRAGLVAKAPWASTAGAARERRLRG